MEQAAQSDRFETRPGCPARIEDSRSHTKKLNRDGSPAEGLEFPETGFFFLLFFFFNFLSHNY